MVAKTNFFISAYLQMTPPSNGRLKVNGCLHELRVINSLIGRRGRLACLWASRATHTHGSLEKLKRENVNE